MEERLRPSMCGKVRVPKEMPGQAGAEGTELQCELQHVGDGIMPCLPRTTTGVQWSWLKPMRQESQTTQSFGSPEDHE